VAFGERNTSVSNRFIGRSTGFEYQIDCSILESFLAPGCNPKKTQILTPQPSRYIREATTAIYVANMPMCWALMRRLFKLHAFDGNSSKTGTNPQAYDPNFNRARTVYGQGMLSSNISSKSNKSKSTEGRSDASWWDRDGMTRTESEEFIIMTPPSKAKVVPLEIWESKEFDVVNDRSSKIEHNRIVQDEMFDGGATTKTVVSARRSESVSSRRGLRHS
jgi:hypothetical protein